MITLLTACSRPLNEANTSNATPNSQNPMTIEENRTKNEAAIRDLIDGYVKAIRAKDINAVMFVYAPDLVAFDVVPPLEYIGAESYRKPWQEFFELYQNPIQYEVHDLSITAGDDVAFSRSLIRLNATMKNGRKTDLWLRWTACYRKTDGKWLIAHLQVSVPVDLGNGKAMLDLKPWR